ncbi:hypothetical protein [Halomonas kalidii]|uniref:Uncharacterized protein n=1 Tax=Halomonas kalidii TaxID=3043293 RepID=A0ABT6VRJ0_9GAMM|nr:hypothetical protein [Halomonas kalidii]MDI5936250.1 hypothetical protein [Halomonas kalidii]
MPPVQSAACNAAARGHRPALARRPARWWLAGLLVGCLLPAGLAQVESLRHAERIAQICILAPALIRASSRLQARRRALTRWPTLCDPARPKPRLGLRPLSSPSRRLTAAHDVLTRRGPPAAWAR